MYVVTKLGLLFVYDLETATAVYRNRISPDPIFLAANSDSTGGIVAINRQAAQLLGTVPWVSSGSLNAVCFGAVSHALNPAHGVHLQANRALAYQKGCPFGRSPLCMRLYMGRQASSVSRRWQFQTCCLCQGGSAFES